jgi:formylglycine-generating enzyme required for sulfatase activity
MKWPLIMAVLTAAAGAAGFYVAAPGRVLTATAESCLAATAPGADMVAIPPGRMIMGARPMRAEEGPPRDVAIGGFMIGRTDVTNAQFAAFVAATGYVTRAERGDAPSSLVFVGADGPVNLGDSSQWWLIVPGASWRHPTGPGSSIEGLADLPVVHVAYEDALAYARWLGHDLPSEAEWEYAARGGVDGATYVWGEERAGAGAPKANTWQGAFPVSDSGDDGYRASPSPVGCFPPNGFGLYDMAGNVWQWTASIYHPRAGDDLAPDTASFDPDDPLAPQRVIKGGSFLCSDIFCFRYRPAARTGASPGDGASHIGFRTVQRTPDLAPSGDTRS